MEKQIKISVKLGKAYYESGSEIEGVIEIYSQVSIFWPCQLKLQIDGKEELIFHNKIKENEERRLFRVNLRFIFILITSLF
jgi:hypothetical protein